MELKKDSLSTTSIIRAVQNVAFEVNPQVLTETLEIYAPLHQAGSGCVARDVQYGPHERHVCNVFTPCEPRAPSLPVLVFVHGGGFVRGDKEIVPGRIYDNIGW